MISSFIRGWFKPSSFYSNLISGAMGKVMVFIRLCIMLVFMASCTNGDERARKIELGVVSLDVPALSILINGNHNNHEYWFQSLTYTDSIFIVKLDSLATITIDTLTIPENLEYYEIFVSGDDSIIYYREETQTIFVLNYNNASSHEYRAIGGDPFSTPDFCIVFNDNKVYLANTDDSLSSTFSDRKDYFRQIKPIYQFDLINDTGYIFGEFPPIYQQRISWCETPKICCIPNGKCLFSFDDIDSIYLYENRCKTASFGCKSKYISKIPEYPQEKFFDMVYYKAYMWSCPRYSNIIYNPFSHKVYRIAEHQKRTNQTKTSNLTWSIIVMNESLEIEKEVLFNYSVYNPMIIIPCPYGIYVQRSPLTSKDKLALSLIRI